MVEQRASEKVDERVGSSGSRLEKLTAAMRVSALAEMMASQTVGN